jgi:hypothetical protein
MPGWVLANAVSGFAVVLAGLLALALAALLDGPRHPARWYFVYLCVFITGLPTVWYHGFGEAFLPRVADIGTNLFLAWALQAATLGDPVPPARARPAWRVPFLALSAALIAAFLLWMLALGPQAYTAIRLSLGAVGAFSGGELLLIANSLFVVFFFYAGRAAHPRRALPLLHLVTALFALGLFFATASNDRVDFTILAHHATWHLLAAFGFLALWAFNHARFGSQTAPSNLP